MDHAHRATAGVALLLTAWLAAGCSRASDGAAPTASVAASAPSGTQAERNAGTAASITLSSTTTSSSARPSQTSAPLPRTGRDTVNCTGAITQVLNADVVVNPGVVCLLQGATIAGSVTVQAGGLLEASGARIGGNVAGEAPLKLHLNRVTVGGSLDVLNAANVELTDVTIAGAATFTGSRGATTLTRVQVTGTLGCTDLLVPPTTLEVKAGGGATGECAPA